MGAINVFNAAVTQLQTSQKNLAAISLARRKADQEDELLDIRKKQAELAIKEKETTGEVVGMKRDFLKSQMDAYFGQQQTIVDGKLAMIDQAHEQEKALSDKSMALAKNVIRNVPAFRDQGGLLEPVYSGGSLAGFRPKKDPAGVKSGAEKTVYTRKDVISEARNMWKDAGSPTEKTIDDYMTPAEDRLAGRAPQKAREAVPYETVPDPSAGLSVVDRILTADSAFGGRTKSPTGSRPSNRPVPSGSGFNEYVPPTVNSTFKPGDIREKNGIKYQRQENGQWLPL